MASIGRRQLRRPAHFWPGFVDALSTLLMVMFFVMMVFMLAQFFMGQALSGRDQALERLGRQVRELSDLLALERKATADLRLSVGQLSAELQVSTAERQRLAGRAAEAGALLAQLQAMTRDAGEARGRAESMSAELDEAFRTMTADREKIELQVRELALLRQDVAALKALRQELEAKVAELGAKAGEQQGQLAEERRISDEARAHAALLNQQLDTLRQEMLRLNAALEASEKLSSEQKIEIANLGQRLNQALAGKVEELQRFRSEFFGRLRQLLGEREGIRVEGDRFVFQSELLFPSGSSDLEPGGQLRLMELADTLKQIIPQIPSDLNWVLRVDGHTDRIPIATARFPSNWELSTARATSVVKFLITQGIPAERLAAAGFGEFHPIDAGDTPEGLAKNRRIEVRFDQR